MKSVFEYKRFTLYLNDLANSKGPRGGVKQELAEVMGVHPAYLSRVLSGKAQLNLEQIERAASHFALDEDGKRYLLFLLEEERAGTQSLKKFFENERTKILEKRLNIKERIHRSRQITIAEQSQYYSTWIYSALHVVACIPGFDDSKKIAGYLGVTEQTVKEGLEFLERIQIVRWEKGRWIAGERHLHLDKTSPFIKQHHTNWKMRSILALDKQRPTDIRYSGAFAMSLADAETLREIILRHLKDYLERVRNSTEEKAYAFSFDFYEF